MNTSFYVDLFSNASLDQFPENIVSQFRVSLEQPMLLDGSYSCALSEFICPKTAPLGQGDTEPIKIYIKTFAETTEETRVGVPSNVSPYFSSKSETFLQARKPPISVEVTETSYTPQNVEGKRDYVFSFTFRLDTFDTFKDFLSFFSTLFKGESESNLREEGLTEFEKQQNATVRNLVKRRVIGTSYPLGLYEDKGRNKFVLKIRDSGFYVAVPSTLTRLLGVDSADNQWTVYLKPGKYDLPSKPRLSDTLLSVRPNIAAIYTNIVRPIAVGNVRAPLLRVCRIPNESSADLHTFEFTNEHFLPVALTYIQTIDVEIRASDGSLVPFANTGVAYLRLHFKKSA